MKTSRRRFASLALTAAAAPLVTSLAEAQTAAATPPPATVPPAPAAADGLADALTAVVRAQYGTHLTAAELETVQKDLTQWVPAIRRLREFPLTNADEPDCSFSAVGAHDVH